LLLGGVAGDGNKILTSILAFYIGEYFKQIYKAMMYGSIGLSGEKNVLP
jgi:hypothetical protein